MKDAEKQDHLFSLKDKGVGALYLGHARTPFALKSDTNALLGQVRSTGVFLNYDLALGRLRPVDWATQPVTAPPRARKPPSTPRPWRKRPKLWYNRRDNAGGPEGRPPALSRGAATILAIPACRRLLLCPLALPW